MIFLTAWGSDVVKVGAKLMVNFRRVASHLQDTSSHINGAPA